MKKVEADTLEEAYQKAATQLASSITDIEYEVIQHPSKGLFGFLKKKAIIVATCKNVLAKTEENASKETPFVSDEESVATEILSVVKEVVAEDSVEVLQKELTQKRVVKEEMTVTVPENGVVVDNFFAADKEEDLLEDFDEESIIYDELALLIENQLKELLTHSCFDIDIVEVDVRDNTALIFIDGEDAALLIGKEGYRYNALSYMLFNWLHTKYELFIKLEIAEFLTSQQEMIRNYIKPVIENVQKNGKGKTRSLDGILVQIALEQLREAFPNKYVAVKTGRGGNKFVVVNEFNNKSHA
ncbi:MAG TPA: protein jag [Sulfurovum sp.]|nr:protein jag [Sulfurovum sp.]